MQITGYELKQEIWRTIINITEGQRSYRAVAGHVESRDSSGIHDFC